MHPIEALVVPIGLSLRKRRPDVTTGIGNDPDLAGPQHIRLTSPSFEEGGTIPKRYCGQLIGQDISPALAWSPLPRQTRSALLVIEDLDALRAKPGILTIAAFVPHPAGLAEGALQPSNRALQFLAPGDRYNGPRPLPGHGTHHYRFHLSALDRPLDLGEFTGTDDLLPALAGRVLASGALTGKRSA
jgi:phosphatidylethanolamine-binding protein (PEBP) family uncharacterized protein